MQWGVSRIQEVLLTGKKGKAQEGGRAVGGGVRVAILRVTQIWTQQCPAHGADQTAPSQVI